MLELQEPINVWVYFGGGADKGASAHFKGGSPQPYIFFWKNRRIKIDKINLIHTSKDGASLLYHFSVSSGGNFYK